VDSGDVAANSAEGFGSGACAESARHLLLDTKTLNLAEKLIVKGVKAPVGDFRDWDAITSWASAIADALQKED
jgi:hypothetical protein